MKFGICIDCKKNVEISGSEPQQKPLVAGRCQFHYANYRRVVCAERKKNRNKVENSRNIPATVPETTVNLVSYYQYQMNKAKGYCANCGEPISRLDRHSSIAHVLPKKKNHGFPSVADNPLNALELGPRCGCHNKYDLSWLSASKMKIFPQAVQIAIKLYPLLTQEEKGRFPEVFQKYINE